MYPPPQWYVRHRQALDDHYSNEGIGALSQSIEGIDFSIEESKDRESHSQDNQEPIGKVNVVCEAMRKSMELYEQKLFLSIILTYVRIEPPRYDLALQRIRATKDMKQQGFFVLFF